MPARLPASIAEQMTGHKNTSFQIVVKAQIQNDSRGSLVNFVQSSKPTPNSISVVGDSQSDKGGRDTGDQFSSD